MLIGLLKIKASGFHLLIKNAVEMPKNEYKYAKFTIQDHTT